MIQGNIHKMESVFFYSDSPNRFRFSLYIMFSENHALLQIIHQETCCVKCAHTFRRHLIYLTCLCMKFLDTQQGTPAAKL